MSDKICLKIDGKEICTSGKKTIVEVAAENGIYIPVLCHYQGLKPCASCRVCTVKLNGRYATACSTPIADGMEIESETAEIQDIRKSIIELLFVEGNHYCPTCEMSGNCELQALAYRMKMFVPRFVYSFPVRKTDGSNPKLIIDHNRCIRCKRCIRSIKDEDGRSYFAFINRGNKIEVEMDPVLGPAISDELAAKAMDICPVGAILVKEIGFSTPIGERKYDKKPIGHEIEELIDRN